MKSSIKLFSYFFLVNSFSILFFGLSIFVMDSNRDDICLERHSRYGCLSPSGLFPTKQAKPSTEGKIEEKTDTEKEFVLIEKVGGTHNADESAEAVKDKEANTTKQGTENKSIVKATPIHPAKDDDIEQQGNVAKIKRKFEGPSTKSGLTRRGSFNGTSFEGVELRKRSSSLHSNEEEPTQTEAEKDKNEEEPTQTEAEKDKNEEEPTQTDKDKGADSDEDVKVEVNTNETPIDQDPMLLEFLERSETGEGDTETDKPNVEVKVGQADGTPRQVEEDENNLGENSKETPEKDIPTEVAKDKDSANTKHVEETPEKDISTEVDKDKDSANTKHVEETPEKDISTHVGVNPDGRQGEAIHNAEAPITTLNQAGAESNEDHTNEGVTGLVSTVDPDNRFAVFSKTLFLEELSEGEVSDLKTKIWDKYTEVPFLDESIFQLDAAISSVCLRIDIDKTLESVKEEKDSKPSLEESLGENDPTATPKTTVETVETAGTVAELSYIILNMNQLYFDIYNPSFKLQATGLKASLIKFRRYILHRYHKHIGASRRVVHFEQKLRGLDGLLRKETVLNQRYDGATKIDDSSSSTFKKRWNSIKKRYLAYRVKDNQKKQIKRLKSLVAVRDKMLHNFEKKLKEGAEYQHVTPESVLTSLGKGATLETFA